MDIEPDIEFFLHRCVCQFAFHIDESERFPAKTRTVLAALSSRTTRENMKRQTHRLFQADERKGMPDIHRQGGEDGLHRISEIGV
jgi:hypothetical protein